MLPLLYTFRSLDLQLTTSLLRQRNSRAQIFKGLVSVMTLLLLSLCAFHQSSAQRLETAATPVSPVSAGRIVNGKFAQVPRPTDAPKIRIVKDQPTVYVTFERIGKREPLENGESNEGLWLRLNNNTNWSIKLEMEDVPEEAYGDAGLFYEVLAKDQVVIDARCHVCSHDKLGPGKSLSFSLPREYLTKGRAIRISFAYEWEDDEDKINSGEPEHHVYFHASQIPKESLEARQNRK